MIDHIATVMIVAGMLLWYLRDWRAKHRCRYCGVDGGHKPDCPFSGIEGM